MKIPFSTVPLLTRLLVLFIVFLCLAFFWIFRDLPSPYSLKDFKVTPISTKIFDRSGTLLYEIYRDQNRTPVRLKDLPPSVAQATIAIEDKDFYHHQGVSVVSGVFRAVREMVVSDPSKGVPRSPNSS